MGEHKNIWDKVETDTYCQSIRKHLWGQLCEKLSRTEKNNYTHTICGMQLLFPALDTCFWCNTPHILVPIKIETRAEISTDYLTIFECVFKIWIIVINHTGFISEYILHVKPKTDHVHNLSSVPKKVWCHSLVNNATTFEWFSEIFIVLMHSISFAIYCSNGWKYQNTRYSPLITKPSSVIPSVMGFLPETENCMLPMHWECRERFHRHQLQRNRLVSDPGMHHGTCVTHVPRCMSGSLARGGGKNVPGACATRNFTYLTRGPWPVIA